MNLVLIILLLVGAVLVLTASFLLTRTTTSWSIGPSRVLVALALCSALLTSCTPSQTSSLLQPSQALGAVLAEEAARLAGANKRVALVAPDASWGPTSTAEQAFRAALTKQGFQIVSAGSANVGNPMRRGQIGFKAEEFIAALEKSADAGAFVSFAGAPLLKAADAARLSPNHPPVLVVATASLGNVAGLWSDPVQLAGLIEADLVQLAIIDNPEPAPQPAKADATHEVFSQHFRILRRPR